MSESLSDWGKEWTACAKEAVSAAASGRKEPARRVKVNRECPRCHVRAYQWGNDKGIPNLIVCVNCGHEWVGRIRRDEQRDDAQGDGHAD